MAGESGLGQYYPAWSPAGGYLAFEQLSPDGLFVLNLSSGKKRQIVSCRLANCTQDMWPAWSPDGSLIAFGRVNGGPSQIFVVPSGGGPVRQVTSGPQQHNLPSW